MPRKLQLLLVATSMLLAIPVSAQETAGRFLIAVGDVHITRGNQRLPAARGAEVRVGDTVDLGVQSNAQIRMTDASIVSLRPETTFRISEYAYEGKTPETQRAFFDLLKGGLRTVTGLIGQVRQDNYGVKTLTSTIGIRGTHYALVECVGGCRNADGSVAPNGTYGAVTDGRIGVTNQAGERQFGADQYFHVASATSVPQPLLAPPSFVRDTLEGQARARQQQQAQTSEKKGEQKTEAQMSGGQSEKATTLAQTGLTGGTSDAGAAVPDPSATMPVALDTNVFLATDVVGVQGPTTLLQPTSTGTIFYRLDSSGGPLNLPITCTNPPCGTLVVGAITMAVNLTTQLAFIQVAAQDDIGEFVNLGTPGGVGIPLTASGGVISFNTTFNSANFPENKGAFRCSDCSVTNGPGTFTTIGYSGTINGTVATLTVSASDPGGSGFATGTLSQTTPPNNDSAALVIPTSGGGSSVASGSYWQVAVDGTRRLTRMGEFGNRLANVGTATNTIVGSAPAAGNLVWGSWTGGGAVLTDVNYVTYTTTGQFIPWITGDAPNTLPSSLGSVTYTPVGSVLSGSGVLNSAVLTADFVNRSIAFSINATNVSAGNTYAGTGSTLFSPINGRFQAGFQTVTCSGPCAAGTPDGGYGGFFAGPNAEGAGVAFNMGYGIGGIGITGAVGMKR